MCRGNCATMRCRVRPGAARGRRPWPFTRKCPDDDLARFIDGYALGGLLSCKGIAEGVENTNYLVRTESGPFILTLYEKRVNREDLPFFLGLMEHLAGNGSELSDAGARQAGRDPAGTGRAPGGDGDVSRRRVDPAAAGRALRGGRHGARPNASRRAAGSRCGGRTRSVSRTGGRSMSASATAPTRSRRRCAP